jgi:hypothetical protein
MPIESCGGGGVGGGAGRPYESEILFTRSNLQIFPIGDPTS